MTPKWDDILVAASSGRSYVLAAPSEDQARFGIWVVARFISNVARGEAWAAFKERAKKFERLAAEQITACEEAMPRFIARQIAALRQASKAVRRELVEMQIEDDGMPLDRPLVTRQRAEHQAWAFHGPRPLLAGETP